MGIEAVSTSFRSISPLVSTIVWMSGYLAVGALHIYIKNWRMCVYLRTNTELP